MFTFVPYEIDGEPSIVASYLCTPLVKFPISALQPGGKIQGTTIAEFGNRNRPLDMIVYEKDGQDYILLSNNQRGVMKVPTEPFAEAVGINELCPRHGRRAVRDHRVHGRVCDSSTCWIRIARHAARREPRAAGSISKRPRCHRSPVFPATDAVHGEGRRRPGGGPRTRAGVLATERAGAG